MNVTLQQALTTGHGQWRSFTCPDHDDKNPSARVNVNTGRWVCMVCGAKGASKDYVPDIDLILEDALDLLEPGVQPKPETWLDQFDSGPVPHYWLSRFAEPVCRLYRFGWDPNKKQPCYPLRDDDGRPFGIVRRNIGDVEGPKYLYPKGVSTSTLMFGIHEVMQTRHLFLVESATTAAAVRESGFDAVGSYGAILHPTQIDILVSLEPSLVIVAYDMDKAGHIGARNAIEALHARGITAERAAWDPRWNDLGDMSLRTRSDTLTKALAA